MEKVTYPGDVYKFTPICLRSRVADPVFKIWSDPDPNPVLKTCSDPDPNLVLRIWSDPDSNPVFKT